LNDADITIFGVLIPAHKGTSISRLTLCDRKPFSTLMALFGLVLLLLTAHSNKKFFILGVNEFFFSRIVDTMNQLLQSILGLSEEEATTILASNPTPDFLVGLVGVENIDTVLEYSSKLAAVAKNSPAPEAAPKSKPTKASKSKPKYKPFKVNPKELSSLIDRGVVQERLTDDQKRYICDCQARVHALLSGCLNCGRVICELEGMRRFNLLSKVVAIVSFVVYTSKVKNSNYNSITKGARQVK
jgi:hypothetical protein